MPSIRALLSGLACLAFVAVGGPAAAVTPAATPAATTAASDEWPEGYKLNHTYYEVGAELTQLAAQNPGIVRLRSIGRTYEGREMWLVKISDNVAVDEPEPEVYVEGGIHAYEHASTEQAMALVYWLVTGYPADPRIAAIVNSTETWIAPMINPDGAMYDISGGAFHGWRKNRTPNPGSTALGTDVNRNFGFKWGCCKHS